MTQTFTKLSGPIYLQTTVLIKRTINSMLYQGFISLCTHIPTLYIGETKNACHIRFSQKHNISILQSFSMNPKCPTISDYINKKPSQA